MQVDHHVHILENFLSRPEVSFDTKRALFERYVEFAADKGLTAIGFSEHAYLFKQAEKINLNARHMSKMLFDLDEYVKIIRSLSCDRIKILLGLEVDYHPDKEVEIRKFASSQDFDFLVGAVHSVGDWEVDIDPDEYKKIFESRGNKKVYQDYYNTVIKLLESGIFDIIGHLDLIKIFGCRLLMSDYEKIIDPVLQAIVQGDMVVEINTNGYNKPIAEQYPSRWILQKCFEKEIKLTFSSDAHTTDRIGENFEKIKEIIENIGYRQIYYCHQGERIRDYLEQFNFNQIRENV